MLRLFRGGIIALCTIALAHVAHAATIAGTNAARVDVTIKAKYGDRWVTVRTTRTDRNGVLTLRNVLPGQYRFFIDDSDRRDGQTLAVEMRIRDKKGRTFSKERATVSLGIVSGDNTITVGTFRTDKRGWLDVVGIQHGITYTIDVKSTARLSKKDHRPRIKVKAKIDGSKWFDAAYARVDRANTLELDNVLPGKYKFRYKRGDAPATRPFTLKMTIRNDKGKRVKNRRIKVYAYRYGVRQKIGTFKTDHKGRLVLPNVLPGKYKLKVQKR